MKTKGSQGGGRASGGGESLPVEPDARAELARKALEERKNELQPEGASPESGGESPGQPGATAPARDALADGAAFAAVVEVTVNGGARLVAARWPATALFVGSTLLPKLPEFALKAGEQLGPPTGLVFPRALTALGGICSMLAWWLRALPAPKLPATAEEGQRAPSEPPPPPAGAFSVGR